MPCAASCQALHAATLGFDHPRTGKPLTLQSPVPADFAQLLGTLREDASQAAHAAVSPERAVRSAGSSPTGGPLAGFERSPLGGTVG